MISKLTDLEKKNIKTSIDFLVPFISALIKLLSSVDINKTDFIKQMKELKMEKILDDGWKVESSATISNFKFYILYTGTRSFVLKVDGLSAYRGFSFMETNKGINIHNSNFVDSKDLTKFLKEQFLKKYKSPYLITNSYKEFLSN
tara:strand:+ start:95466 stop:95900 length:435 start_codon:yes stop_codon:yes gene_type:complete